MNSDSYCFYAVYKKLLQLGGEKETVCKTDRHSKETKSYICRIVSRESFSAMRQRQFTFMAREPNRSGPIVHTGAIKKNAEFLDAAVSVQREIMTGVFSAREHYDGSALAEKLFYRFSVIDTKPAFFAGRIKEIDVPGFCGDRHYHFNILCIDRK